MLFRTRTLPVALAVVLTLVSQENTHGQFTFLSERYFVVTDEFAKAENPKETLMAQGITFPERAAADFSRDPRGTHRLLRSKNTPPNQSLVEMFLAEEIGRSAQLRLSLTHQIEVLSFLEKNFPDPSTWNPDFLIKKKPDAESIRLLFENCVIDGRSFKAMPTLAFLVDQFLDAIIAIPIEQGILKGEVGIEGLRTNLFTPAKSYVRENPDDPFSRRYTITLEAVKAELGMQKSILEERLALLDRTLHHLDKLPPLPELPEGIDPFKPGK